MPILIIIFFSLCIRILFFNGPLGSDDVVYLKRSAEIADGIWNSANYNGSLRYGYNIPAAFFMYLFGINMFTSNLWPLLCSIAEIVLVYIFAASIWGKRTAIISSIILATLPLHIAAATRISPDSVVCFFISFSFVLFYYSEKRNSSILYFITGLVIGSVYWCKELAIIYLLAFIGYPLLFRRFNIKWMFVIAGGLVMLVGHFIIISAIAGDPLHAIKVITSQIDRDIINRDVVKHLKEDQILYYFYYLFIDVRHTLFLGYGALAGLIYCFQRRGHLRYESKFVAYWLVSMIVILSFTIISIEPLKFVTKQSNYLTLFFAPLSLICGYWISSLKKRTSYTMLALMIVFGSILGALEQQSHQVFVSNSKAAVEYSRKNPTYNIYGSINNGNIARFYAVLNNEKNLPERFGYLSNKRMDSNTKVSTDHNGETHVIVDKETELWGVGAFSIPHLPPCWRRVADLAPIGFGAGEVITGWILWTISFLPDTLAKQPLLFISSLYRPKVATVYATSGGDFWCNG